MQIANGFLWQKKRKKLEKAIFSHLSTGITVIAAGLIKCGRNRIVIRVISSEPDDYSGIFRNIFLYQKTTAAKQK